MPVAMSSARSQILRGVVLAVAAAVLFGATTATSRSRITTSTARICTTVTPTEPGRRYSSVPLRIRLAAVK